MAAPAPSVFLSHSGKDKDFVRELYRRLTRDGVSCFFDIASIGWGENWVRALERALDECQYVVFVLSPDFCNSEWVEVERTSNIADDPGGRKRKVRPLMLHPCSHLETFPRFLRQTQTIDVSTTALFEQNYPRICRELGGILRDDAAVSDRTKLPRVYPLPPLHHMPYRSLGDKFVGRVAAIWDLHDSLFRESTITLQGTGVLAGTGGLGKTQLAIEYAHRFGSEYPGGVYWVNADRGLGTLVTQVSAAANIEIDTKAEEPLQVEQLWRELNQRGTPSLLVLDNFSENAPLNQYLPTTGRVHSIVTTRRRDLGHATVRLKMLSTDEGVRLLNSGERQFGTSAAAVVERLGGLPLALELTKSYLNYRNDVGIEALLAELKTAGEIAALDLFATEYRDQLPSGHERDVVQTFQWSWDAAPPPAREVLRVIGELSPAPVPRRVLRIMLDWPEKGALQDELNKSVSELARLSVVELDAAGDPLAHRLILAFVRHRNRVDDASPFARCCAAIQRQMQRTFDNPDANTNRELESLVPHAEYLLATDRMTPQESVDLWNRLAWHHQTMGRFIAAREAGGAALASAEKSFEPGHPSIANSQSNLAEVLRSLGQSEEARDLLRKALASDEQSFEPGHPSIAIRQSNLAIVLKDLGQLEEPRDLLRKALASNEQSFEPGHPSIAIRQSNLALVLNGLGQLEEARDLLRKACSASLARYGPDHPPTKIFKGNLDSLPHT
jgi:tetratricopeptide (TPR) repeat protein